MKKYKIEIKWAAIFLLMQLAWMLIEKFLGFHDKHIDQHAIFTNFIAVPAIVIYVLALLDKRKNYYSGVMNYKQGFMAGLIITIIVTIFSPVTQYITSTFITPEYFPNIIRHTVDQKLMTQEAAESFFNLKSYILQGLVGALVMGIITSAIVAFFTKGKGKKEDILPG